MATVDMSAGVTTLHPTRSGNTSLPYLVEVDLDIAAAATEKGTALAADCNGLDFHHAAEHVHVHFLLLAREVKIERGAGHHGHFCPSRAVRLQLELYHALLHFLLGKTGGRNGNNSQEPQA